jgi:hypothetical protein
MTRKLQKASSGRRSSAETLAGGKDKTKFTFPLDKTRDLPARSRGGLGRTESTPKHITLFKSRDR